MPRIRRSLSAAMLLSLCALAAPAWAIEVTESIEVAIAPDRAWRVVNDFCSIGRWHPALKNCQQDTYEASTTRQLWPEDGGEVMIDELTERLPNEQTLRFRAMATTLPASNLSSVVAVRPGADANSSVVEWTATFDAPDGTTEEQATQAITEWVQAGLAGLKDSLE